MSMQFSARRTVIPNPRGGYEDYDIPNPNQGQQGNLYGTNPTPSLAETSSRADQYHTQFNAARNNQQWNDPNVSTSQRIMNRTGDSHRAPADRRMDAFFQVLQDKGVDKLSADPFTQGGSPSFFGDQYAHGSAEPGAGTASAPPGYTQSRAVDELKKFSEGGAPPAFMTTPGGGQAQMTPSNQKYVQNILSGLRQSGSFRGRPIGDVDAARQDYGIARENQAKEGRAAYLDAQDAKRGLINVRRR